VIGEIWQLIGLARHRFWEFEWQDQNDWKELAKQDIIDVVFMLYQSMIRTWKDSCELDHISVK
jgi:hypothetical protein